MAGAGHTLFSGLTVLLPDTGGLSAEDRARLWAMVTWHGGRLLAGEDAGVTEAALTHVVTSNLETRVREGVKMVTPNWVVDSVRRNTLRDEDSEEYRHFVNTTEAQKIEQGGEVEENDCSNRAPVSISKPEEKPLAAQDFLVSQNELIKSYLATLKTEEREEFYRMSTADKRQRVVERGLIIRIENGMIQLSEEQQEIINKSRESNDPETEARLKDSIYSKKGIQNSDTHYSEKSKFEHKQDDVFIEKYPGPTKTSCLADTDVMESKVKGGNEDENLSRVANLNLTPRKVKAKIILSDEERAVMRKMNRMQKQLYLQKLEKSAQSPQSPASEKVLGRAEAKLNSPRVMNTPTSKNLVSKSLSSSPFVLSSPVARVSSTEKSDRTPSTGAIARSGHKISPKLCLLGCHFVITGYQEREEAHHVRKWTTVITRHGGEVTTELVEGVTHLICPDLASPLASRAEERGLRLVTAHWLNDVITVKKMAAPWKGVHLPLPRQESRGSNVSGMKICVTGFESLDRDYVKDMIEMTGAEYTACLTRNNAAIVCREAAGEKYRKSREWSVPAVSIKWLNEVLFSPDNVAGKLTDPEYNNFDKHKQALGISSKLVSSYLQPWKEPIQITESAYCEYKQRQSSVRSAGEKRSLELDNRILTPERKRRKYEPRPRTLFNKVTY